MFDFVSEDVVGEKRRYNNYQLSINSFVDVFWVFRKQYETGRNQLPQSSGKFPRSRDPEFSFERNASVKTFSVFDAVYDCDVGEKRNVAATHFAAFQFKDFGIQVRNVPHANEGLSAFVRKDDFGMENPGQRSFVVGDKGFQKSVFGFFNNLNVR